MLWHQKRDTLKHIAQFSRAVSRHPSYMFFRVSILLTLYRLYMYVCLGQDSSTCFAHFWSTWGERSILGPTSAGAIFWTWEPQRTPPSSRCADATARTLGWKTLLQAHSLSGPPASSHIISPKILFTSQAYDAALDRIFHVSRTRIDGSKM